MERRIDVFLSYASAERPTVQRIAERLESHHISPWWDKWSLTPGGSWQEEIVDGLHSAKACAVIVGASGLADWAREELAVAQDRAAKDRHFRMFMVLLPGAPELADPNLAFLRTRTWVDLRGGIDDREAIQDLVSAVTGAPRAREAPVATPEICPYRGLEAFDEEHAEFFFGRQEDSAALVDKLRSRRFLAVLGPSGSGKSSLLRAGLIPALRRGALPDSAGWTVDIFTPGARPLTTLAAHMTRLLPGQSMQQTLDQLSADQRSLDLAVALGLDGRPACDRVLLVIDQFEELFTVCRDEHERNSFLANMTYAAAIPGGRVVTLVGMRADFYHRCAAYPDLRAQVADHQFLVGALGPDGLREVIEEPARRVGLELETGLIETIIGDVGNRPGTLPLLEHVLLELWRRRQGPMLTLAGYVASNGVEGALAQRANAVYTDLAPAHRDIARRVLLRLVQPGEGSEDTRRRAAMEELVADSDETGDVDAVLKALSDDRLVTVGVDEVSGGRTVDLTHEALIRGWPELRTWIAEDREALRAQRHLTAAASEWDRRGRADDDLYGGARLAYWKERGLEGLTGVEGAFLAAGRAREIREHAAARRRARLAGAGLLVGVMTVAVVALIGLRRVGDERDLAVAQRDTAQSRQLAAQAAAVLETDPGASLRLALEAFDTKPTQEAEIAVSSAMATPGARVLVLEHRPYANSAAFSPDGKRIVSTGDDHKVLVWEAGGGARRVLEGHEDQVESAVFSPDGRRIVSAGDDGTIRIWDVDAGTKPRVLETRHGEITSVAISPDGTRVASAGEDGDVRVWDLAAGRASTELTGHAGYVWSVAFSPDGRHIVSAGADGTVRVWDWAAAREVRVLAGEEDEVYSAAFSADGSRIAAGGSDAVSIWNWLEGGEPDRSLRGSALTVAFSPDGNWLATGGYDGKVNLWSVPAAGAPTVLQGHAGRVDSVAFSLDGKWLVSAGQDGTVRVWDWSAQNAKEFGQQAGIRTAAFDADGKLVASGGDDAIIRVWDWESGRVLATMRGHLGRVTSLSFSPNGQYVLSAGLDGTARVWDWKSGGEPVLLQAHVGAVRSAAFSPDGSRLVSGGADGVWLWHWPGKDQRTKLEGASEVNSVAFSPDGEFVLAAGSDGMLRVWDAASGRATMEVDPNAGWLDSAAFSPDGKRVAAAGQDGIVRIWDLSSEPQATTLERHEDYAYSVAFSSDGRRLISAGADAVRVWDVAERKERGRYPGYTVSVAVKRDGKAVSVGLDYFRVWNCIPCLPIEQIFGLARSPIWT